MLPITPVHTLENGTQSFDFLRTNAEALIQLERTAFNTGGLSNIVRLSVTLSALEAANRYTEAADDSPQNLTSYIVTSNISLSLSLLDDSLKLLAQFPIPESLFTAGGSMDPADIKDAKLREDFVQFMNNPNSRKVMSLLYRVTQGIDRLKRSINSVIINAHLHNKEKPLKESIISSPLPEPIKEEFLKLSRQP